MKSCFSPFAAAALASASAASAEGLEAAFRAHVQAVQARDLSALEPTITSGASLPLILPDGTRTESRADYLDFHRRFFAEGPWRLRFETLSFIEHGDVGIVSTRSTYKDRDDAAPSHSWVTFVFCRERRQWRLCYDQNTRLPRP